MGLLGKKKAEEAPKKDEKAVKEEVKQEVQEKEPVDISKYIDPDAFVYKVQAGKTFTGMNFEEALGLADALIGKVPKIIISRVERTDQ